MGATLAPEKININLFFETKNNNNPPKKSVIFLIIIIISLIPIDNEKIKFYLNTRVKYL